jgi:glycolate dehydrogenase FAD-binding subunit
MSGESKRIESQAGGAASGVAKPDAAQALEALRAVVAEGGVRRGVPADAICGVVPELYVEPADEGELSRVLRYANQAELLVSPRGSGSKLQWGTPPPAVDLAISTARFNRILEYAPHDMTVIAGAGVSVAQLQSALAAHRQRLALDPLWPAQATVGGVIATNDSGALRLRYGGIRDLILGITVILADGTVATSGGKVVKNVAGYDLPKLMSGALGTLGIITRAVFRLHPVPESSSTLSFAFGECKPANDFILAIADSLAVPSGLQMRSAANGSTYVDVRIDGIEAGIAAQMQAVRKLAGEAAAAVAEGDPWQAREQLWLDSAKTCILKLSVLPTQLASTAQFVRASLGEAGWRLLLYSTGLAWLRVETAESERIVALVASLRAHLAPMRGSAVLLQAPLELRRRVDVWGEAGGALPLMTRIKQQFDPRGILNRARFVGGI